MINPGRQVADDITRSQFRVFDGIGDCMAMSAEDRRRVLLLSPEEWSAWSRVPQGGPLPACPGLPVMLRRLGAASHRLTVVAERRNLPHIGAFQFTDDSGGAMSSSDRRSARTPRTAATTAATTIRAAPSS